MHVVFPSPRRSSNTTSESQMYYTPESYGKINHKNHQPASYSFSFPGSEEASVTHPDFLTPPSSSLPPNETLSQTEENRDLHHHQSHVQEKTASRSHRRPTTEAPVTTIPKPPDFVHMYASTTPSPPVDQMAEIEQWVPKLKPYYGDTGHKSNQQQLTSGSAGKAGDLMHEDDEMQPSIGDQSPGRSRGSGAGSSGDPRLPYSPPPVTPDEYSSDLYQNYTKDPIDWSALLLNYSKSNENFNATSFQELTRAYSRVTDTRSPSSFPLSTSKSQKRRRFRPKASTASTTSSTTTTSTTTSTTPRPPKIYLQPTIEEEDEEENDDPPANIYADSGPDEEASESSHGTQEDLETGKEADNDNRYNYPLISSPKSRTKGNYIGRPYNYHDLVSQSSRSPVEYLTSGSRHRNHQANRLFHRHQLHASSGGDGEEDESSPKYSAIRHHYQHPHRFASPSSPYYFPVRQMMSSPASNGDEGTHL